MPKTKVDIFIPCFVDQMFPETAFNMIKVLEKAGCEVHYNEEQTCCGQPAFNSGFWNECFDVGSKFISDFPNERNIVCPSASCTGMVRNYYTDIFQQSAQYSKCKIIQKNMFEFSEYLVDVLDVTDFGAELNGIVTYHDSCSGLREIGIKDAPRKLLANVKGLSLNEMKTCDTCCGFGGTFAVKYEPISFGMADQKMLAAIETGAEYMISSDLSCLMHLDGYVKQNKLNIKLLHIADVLAMGW